jgi:hypothetical protein
MRKQSESILECFYHDILSGHGETCKKQDKSFTYFEVIDHPLHSIKLGPSVCRARNLIDGPA